MLQGLRQESGRQWISALGCIVLVGIAFLLGYRQGTQVQGQSSAPSMATSTPYHPLASLVRAPDIKIPPDATPELKTEGVYAESCDAG